MSLTCEIRFVMKQIPTECRQYKLQKKNYIPDQSREILRLPIETTNELT